MLQTMMQTVCQLVNNEIISTKKPTTANAVPQQPPMNSARTHRDRVDFQIAEPRQNWPIATNNAQVPRSKMSSADELLSYTQRMNTGALRFCFLLTSCHSVLGYSDSNRRKSVSLFDI